MLSQFEKLAQMQETITDLFKEQQRRKEHHWEQFGTTPLCPSDESDRAPSVSIGATARLAFAALETSSVGSETEGATSKAPMPTVPPRQRQGHTFGNEDNALFEVRDYDGTGGGFFAVSEQGVNRNVPIASPSVSTGVKADTAADDADDGMPDAEEDDEDEPIGPRLVDQPLDEHPAGTAIEVHCTGCHRDVKPIHFNVCPECELTDSFVVLNGSIAQACRLSRKVNGQYVMSTELRNAIQQNVTTRLLARMKVEPSAEPGGLPP